MKFCSNCNNILEKITKNDILSFECSTCLNSIPAEPSDTLMLNISLKESESLYKEEIYLDIAKNDDLAPLVNKQCAKCDETIIKQIMIGDRMEAMFICPKCGHKMF